jgi:hypothetical protein
MTDHGKRVGAVAGATPLYVFYESVLIGRLCRR